MIQKHFTEDKQMAHKPLVMNIKDVQQQQQPLVIYKLKPATAELRHTHIECQHSKGRGSKITV